MKEETHYARQLFTVGDGTNPPIKNIKTLSKAAGVPERTLRDHVPKWREECKEVALMSENSPYTLSLSPETLTQHRNEIIFLGNEVKRLRATVKRLRKDGLHETPSYYAAFGAYQSALKQWEQSSGMTAHYKAAEAALRESARVSAREKAKRDAQGETPRQAHSGVNSSRFDLEG